MSLEPDEYDLDVDAAFPPSWFLAYLHGYNEPPSLQAQLDSFFTLRPEIARYQPLIAEAVTRHGELSRSDGALMRAMKYDLILEKKRKLAREKTLQPVFAFLVVEAGVTEGWAQSSTEERMERWKAGALADHDRYEVKPVVSPVESTHLGPGLRVQYVADMAGGPMRLVVEHAYFPTSLPFAVRAMFNTSNLAMASVLVEEFDSIAATVQVALAPDDNPAGGPTGGQ
ncbi:MAG TPA: hypothetical protein VFN61_12980 [Acidimicrobiales bacterium]|nr:hypothetical protein [Acidimicrobiales bacterium]